MHTEQECRMELVRADDGRICKEYQHVKTLLRSAYDLFWHQQAIVSVDAGSKFRLVFSWRASEFRWFSCDGIKITVAVGGPGEAGNHVQSSWHPLKDLESAEDRAVDVIASLEIDCFARWDDIGHWEELLNAPAPTVYDLDEPLGLTACREYRAEAGCVHASFTRGKLTPHWVNGRDVSVVSRPEIPEENPSFRLAGAHDWETIPEQRFRALKSENGASFMFTWTNVASEVVDALQLEDWSVVADLSDEIDKLHRHFSGNGNSTSGSEEDIISDPDEGADSLIWELPRRRTTRFSIGGTGQSRYCVVDHGRHSSQSDSASKLNNTSPLVRSSDIDSHHAFESEPQPAASDSSNAPAVSSLKRKRSVQVSRDDEGHVAKTEDIERKPKIEDASPTPKEHGTKACPLISPEVPTKFHLRDLLPDV
ncbi:hypothetical protein LTR95_010876 [Oleoguttula sp. CCFEE 5521]